jgi:hypothetical protein
MKQRQSDEHSARTRRAIELILKEQGSAYTLGLLMGMLCRLSRTDSAVTRELETRSQSQPKDLT